MIDQKKADSLRLNVDTLLLKPLNYDWTEGYCEKWEVIQPYDSDDFDNMGECPDCEGIGEILTELDKWEKCDSCKGSGENDTDELGGYSSFEDLEISNVPMMNYYYPLPPRYSFDKEDAQKIEHTNLCLVYFIESEEYALALTGGGMDLSWSICEAHIRLGYYPPTHFRLPNMSGMTATERNLETVNACIKGRQIVGDWMTRDIEELERTITRLKENTPKQ